MEPHNHHPVILFDGVCNLCNKAVQTVIKNDPRKHFKLGSLQGQAGSKLLHQHQLSHLDLSTFVLIEKGKAYTRSTAALRVCRSLKGLWPLLYIFIIVPAPIRNGIYSYIAKHRYQWFGKKDSCMIPTPEMKDRFID